jgi:hypothetical protein
MSIIHFNNNDKLQFVFSLLCYDKENPFGLVINDEHNLSCSDDIISIMLERLTQDKTAVFPFRNKNKILYLVLSIDNQKLLRHSDEISSFIVPVYAERYSFSSLKFEPGNNIIGNLGSKLFPHGYINFRSPESLLSEVLQSLRLWTILDDSRPEITEEGGEVNAYILRSKFHQAIVLQRWEDASDALNLLLEGHYISDENYHFLRIQFLSAQSKWDEIWESQDFTIISGLHPLPKSVRKAMLTSFYRVILSYNEEKGNIKEVITAFEKNINRLGTLINYRTGLKDDIFQRIFAYSAAVERNREKLLIIKDEIENIDTISIIEKLLTIVNNEEIVEPEPEISEYEPIERALKYFQEYMYDEAYIEVMECEISVKKVKILLGVATVTEDDKLCKEALDAFGNLYKDDQEVLKKDPVAKGWIKSAQVIISEKQIIVGIEVSVTTWEVWFELLISGEMEKNFLADAAHNLISHNQGEYIKSSSIEKLDNMLLDIITSDSITIEQKQLLKNVLPDFAGYILEDSGYPNEHAAELYESLLAAIELYSNKNPNTVDFLLRLSEGLILIDIGYCEKIWQGLERWFDFQPNIKISFYTLEGIIMFNEYGIPSIKLINIWNNWVSAIIENFTIETHIQMSSWLEIGERINANFTLLKMLREKLEAVNIEVDPLSLLAESTIVIFSLREKSAKRAATAIMSRNPKLKLRICTDDSLTEQAKNYASNSDISIIVTACLSHALFYGIMPLLRNPPLYPRSSGETGILQCVEDYCSTLI